MKRSPRRRSPALPACLTREKPNWSSVAMSFSSVNALAAFAVAASVALARRA